jgi:tetratricopeptide (TPR) repeat protein
MRNNAVYIFDFAATGSRAAKELPNIAETMLMNFKELIPGVAVAGKSNIVQADPKTLSEETGMVFPTPGPNWQIIPDDVPLLSRSFSKLSGSTGQVLIGDLGDVSFRGMSAGKLGSPSVGWRNPGGDTLGGSVFYLPEQMCGDLAHIADLAMLAWIKDAAVDRRESTSIRMGDQVGQEFSGFVTRDIVSTPYLMRACRRGDYVYLMGVAGLSQNSTASDLKVLLDTASFKPPAINLQDLGLGYTPPVCQAVQRSIISALGKEKEDGGKHAEALAFYQQAWNTRADPHILMRLCELMSMLQKKDEALALMKKMWKIVPADAAFLANAAIFVTRNGDIELGNSMFHTSLRFTDRGVYVLPQEKVDEYLTLLRDKNSSEQAMRIIDTLDRITPGTQWKLWEAHILYNSPDKKGKALEIMETLMASVRRSRGVAAEIMQFLKAQKAHGMGLETAVKVLRYDAQNPMAWLLKATCEREMGDTKASDATLKKASSYNPNLHSLGDLVLALSDNVGGPVLDANAQQITPVPSPGEVNELIKSVTNAPPQSSSLAAPNNSYEYVYRYTAVTSDPGSPGRYTRRIGIRIHDSTAMEAFNILKFPYQPQGQRIQVNDLKVVTPDGKSLSQNNLSHAFISEDNGSGLHTGMKLLNLPVAGLTPGCLLEYTVTEESLGLQMGALTLRHIFGAEAPTQLDLLYIHSPTTKIEHRHSRGRSPRMLNAGMLWIEKQLPALTNYAHQPPLEDLTPVVWTGDAKQTWSEVGNEYYSFIKHKLQPTEAIGKLASEKTRQCKTDAERIAVLSDYARESVSYAAIEFGLRGLIPNTAADTLKNRYGDCKDHSVLLHDLLISVGIPARLALVNPQTSIQPDLPSLGAFNHMITAVPGQEPDSWDFIDGTNKSMAPKAGVPPWLLAGRKALILGDDPSPNSTNASKLVDIGKRSGNDELITIQRLARITNESTLQIQETISLTGVEACEMRYLIAKSNDKPATFLNGYFGFDRTRYQIKSASVEQLKSVHLPLVLKLDYEVRNAVQIQGDAKLVHLPTLAEIRLSSPYEAGTERSVPLFFEAPLQLTSTTRLTLPPALTVSAKPPPTQVSDGVAWECTRTFEEGVVVANLALTRMEGKIAPAAQSKFHSAILDASQALEVIPLVPAQNFADPLATKASPKKAPLAK